MDGEITIRIGQHELPIYPQRHAYLTNRFGRFVNVLLESGEQLSGESIARFLGERTYEALSVLVPNLESRLPEYEFVGYGSQQALDQARTRDAALAAKDDAEAALAARVAEGDGQGGPLPEDEEARLRADIDAVEVPDDPYDEREDKSPTFPEIAAAFETAVRVNRFDALKILGRLVDPTLLRRWVNAQLAAAIQSSLSPSSPSTSGELTSTTSSTTPPTSTGSGAGPTGDWKPSAAPTSDAVPVS